jgi:hypothetical protein
MENMIFVMLCAGEDLSSILNSAKQWQESAARIIHASPMKVLYWLFVFGKQLE